MTLGHTVEQLRLQVSDNGIGFDLQQDHGGLGLKSMQERASQMGAQLNIQSAPRAGTKITVEVPL